MIRNTLRPSNVVQFCRSYGGGALLWASYTWCVENILSWLSIRICASQVCFSWELTNYPCRRSPGVEEYEVHHLQLEMELTAESERERKIPVPHLIMTMIHASDLFAAPRTTFCQNGDPGLTQETGGLRKPMYPER